MLPSFRDTRHSVRRKNHVVVVGLQAHVHAVAHVRIVLDDEDRSYCSYATILDEISSFIDC